MRRKYYLLLIGVFLLAYIILPCVSEEPRNFKSNISRYLKYIEATSPVERESGVISLGSMYELYQDKEPELQKRKQEVITVIKKCLNDENIEVRREAVKALIKIDTDTIKGLMPPLIEILKDKKESEFDKLKIAGCLKYIGSEAKEALPVLLELTKKATRGYGENIVYYADDYIKAIESIGSPEALESVKPFKQRQKQREKIFRFLLSSRANFIITLCYILLFLWSIRLRKKGKKVFHWFILIPIVWHTLNWISPDDPWTAPIICKVFIFFALISLGPWLASWLVYKNELRIKFLAYSLLIIFIFLMWFFFLKISMSMYSPLFIFFALVGFIPWLISWVILWYREKKQTTEKS